jgi:hypothetical protein
MQVNRLCKLMTLHDTCGHARSFVIVLDPSKDEI